MIHDELAMTVEQIEEAALAFGAVKRIGLFELDHRQPAALSTDPVVVLRDFFLVCKERFPSCQPRIACCNRGMCKILGRHGSLLSSHSDDRYRVASYHEGVTCTAAGGRRGAHLCRYNGPSQVLQYQCRGRYRR